MHTWPYCLLCLLALLSAVHSKPRDAGANIYHQDLEYLKCDICRAVTKATYKVVEQLRLAQARGDKDVVLDEMAINDVIDLTCNASSTEGQWIDQQDIMVRGKKLILVDQQEKGQCKKECRTIQAGCIRFAEEWALELAEVLLDHRLTWRIDNKEKHTDHVRKVKKPKMTLKKMITRFCETRSELCPSSKRMTKKQALARRGIDERFVPYIEHIAMDPEQKKTLEDLTKRLNAGEFGGPPMD